MTVETALDLIEEATGADETVRASIVTERKGDLVSVLVLREQPARDGDGTVLHLRFAKVDLDRHTVQWAKSNGMFITRTENVPVGLLKAFAAVRDGAEGTVFNGLNAGSDDLAREILDEPLDQEREVVDHSDEIVENGHRGQRVFRCEKCGEKAPREDLENFGGGLVDAFVHRGGCPDE